ncbi:MAG: pyridoxine 5'-phosphate synthase [Hyphomicrobiaceae bacterium]
MRKVRLGVNIDHVATVRNARGGEHPDPVSAATLALASGADGITIHLREDRRHIRDDDLKRLAAAISAPINLEMAVTNEMVAIARLHRPHAVCLVPERRQEVTTEGGLDAAGRIEEIQTAVAALKDSGIRVSLFIDPDTRQIDAAKAIGVPVVELHTGAYAASVGPAKTAELQRLQLAARAAGMAGIECHAGHGLTFDNVADVSAIPQVVELNIGHFLIGEAIFVGLERAIVSMRARIDEGIARSI